MKSRQSSLIIYQALKKKPGINLTTSLKICLLFLAAQAQKVAALNTSGIFNFTWHQFGYPETTSPFQSFPDRLASDCGMEIGQPPENTTFRHVAAAKCTWNGAPSGPVVDVNVEMGKNLSSTLISCMDQILRALCDTYNAQQHPPQTTPQTNLGLIVGFSLGGAVTLIVVAIVLIATFSKSKCAGGSLSSGVSSDSGSSYTPDTTYTPSDTYTPPADTGGSSGVSWTFDNG